MSNGTTNFTTTPEATAVARIMKESLEPRVLKATAEDLEGEIVLVPNGAGTFSVTTSKAMLADYRKNPERRRGTARLSDLESFCAHVCRFKDEGSAIFADPSAAAPKLLAVLDYHPGGADALPRFGVHKALYEFPLSDEWKAWASASGQSMAQGDFARWIEDHLLDVRDPKTTMGNGTVATDLASVREFAEGFSVTFATPGKLLELSRGLTVHVGQKVAQHVNLASGEGSISFTEEHSDAKGAPIKIPGAFLLAIPVFRNGAPYVIPTRLRYRTVGGQTSWSFEMHRKDRVLDHAIAEACSVAEQETKLPVFMGTPEA